MSRRLEKETVEVKTYSKITYSLDKVKKISKASKLRDTEEEFWCDKSYTSNTKSQKLVVFKKALVEHVEYHLESRDHLVDQNLTEIFNTEKYYVCNSLLISIW